ncbi:MarR family transcriptional regulator [Sphingomonas sp.]|uniref:MarR family winged helix-turn-helix transcriptional regulator n=1 Tax=Sphingomonas sp. TaxID=28214 RepID=UPI001EBA9C7A|nr:MarR family transcriptional regulator [Sphingomonas sp.]MBX3595045.1 MarR family transcriptional regulator [Sphingomonas sp.]
MPKTKGKPPKKRISATKFRFGYLVHDVSRTRRTLMDQYMRPLGITRSQWTVMSALSRGDETGLMQVDLARLLDVGKVTVGGLIDRLENTGHVERRPDPGGDRRVKRVFITEQGYEILDKMIDVSEDLNQRILDGITPEELAITEDVLMRVKENIRKETMAAAHRPSNDDG